MFEYIGRFKDKFIEYIAYYKEHHHNKPNKTLGLAACNLHTTSPEGCLT